MKLADYIAAAIWWMVEEQLRRLDPNEVFFSLGELRTMAANFLHVDDAHIPSEILRDAIVRLGDAGLVEAFQTPHAAPRFLFEWPTISAFGERLQRDAEGFTGVAWTANRLGADWLRESFEGALGDPEAALPDDHVAEAIVPAADRYVTIEDNRRSDLSEILHELSVKVSADNEVREEDRLVALSEIAAFEATISQPRISAELIERFVRKVIVWIRRVFSAALIAEVAERLTDELAKLI